MVPTRPAWAAPSVTTIRAGGSNTRTDAEPLTPESVDAVIDAVPRTPRAVTTPAVVTVATVSLDELHARSAPGMGELAESAITAVRFTVPPGCSVVIAGETVTRAARAPGPTNTSGTVVGKGAFTPGLAMTSCVPSNIVTMPVRNWKRTPNCSLSP